MHSHDRTLLARLGFQDPDKRNPLHDRACAYLGEPEQAARLTRLVADLALPPPETITWAAIMPPIRARGWQPKRYVSRHRGSTWSRQ